MPPKRIVITGAPGTGKTALIKELEKQGHQCYHEIIRDMTAEVKKLETTKKKVSNPLVFVDDPLAFNKVLINGRKKHFEDSLRSKGSICFFDRGIPDVLAYMDYFGQYCPATFKVPIQNNRYDYIFILPPWRAIYTSDNERLETFEEAQGLHLHLCATYKSFGYAPISVPKGPVAERAAFILENSI